MNIELLKAAFILFSASLFLIINTDFVPKVYKLCRKAIKK